jgi:hypothetical protein
MELLGFSGWNRLNESSETLYSQFEIKTGNHRQGDVDLLVSTTKKAATDLFPNYKAEVRQDMRNYFITFTYQDDEFGLFGDTGTSKPIEIGINIFFVLNIGAKVMRQFKIFSKVYNQPKKEGFTSIIVSPREGQTIDDVIDKVAAKLINQYASNPEPPEKPTDAELDQLALADHTPEQLRNFSDKFNDYMQYLTIIEWLKSSIIRQFVPSIEDYQEDLGKQVDIIMSAKLEGPDDPQLKTFFPTILKLYYDSQLGRVESKAAADLLAKALSFLIKETGNQRSLFTSLGKLSRLS